MDHTRPSSNPKASLIDSGLAPHVDAFAQHLKLGRYSYQTTRTYLSCIAHFARWMSDHRLQIEQLDAAAVRRFLDHLPRCDCPRPAIRTYADLRAACNHLLHVLRARSVIAPPAPATGAIADELRRFDEYMRSAQGLSAETRSGHVRIVRRLLLKRFADQPLVPSALLPADVRRFVAAQLKRRGSASNASAIAAALRTYLRYRTMCGDQVHALAGVIASPAHWSLASLPQSLSREEASRLLRSFTAQVPSFRRGYAMVRCALDMGLRASEIAKLALADIDWRAGTVTLRSTKSRREDVLPLPVVTGRAIAAYLRSERPPSTNPAVFVRLLAPRDVPISSGAVRRVVRNAYRRIGVMHTRTHALRHTFACQLLEGGSSIKEIADVLRHRSLNTTLIYAKLDQRKLRGVALPWPGSAS